MFDFQNRNVEIWSFFDVESRINKIGEKIKLNIFLKGENS